jgi:hypothetical protein
MRTWPRALVIKVLSFKIPRMQVSNGNNHDDGGGGDDDDVKIQ